MGMNLGRLPETVRGREAWHAALHRVTKRRTQLGTWTTTIALESMFSPSPPTRSTKSEGPVHGAAHRNRFPSRLYPVPGTGVHAPAWSPEGPLLHWPPHPPGSGVPALHCSSFPSALLDQIMKVKAQGVWMDSTDSLILLPFILGFSIQGAFARFSSPPEFFSLERNLSPTKGWTHQSRRCPELLPCGAGRHRSSFEGWLLLQETQTSITSSWPFLTWKLTHATSL